MSEDIVWLTEQCQRWTNHPLPLLLQELGTATVAATPTEADLYVLVPHNPRLQRIIVRTQGGYLRLLHLDGGTFSVPFAFVRALAQGYRRTFNTYDDSNDEQFFFYPALPSQAFIAIEGWVAPMQQQADLTRLTFSNLTFHFGLDLVPFHYRDGWQLERQADALSAKPATTQKHISYS